jgi:excisionase family DNA binding protein
VPSVAELKTVAEVSRRLRLSPDTVRRKIAAGELRAVRIGGEHGPLRIPADAVDELLRPAVRKAAA